MKFNSFSSIIENKIRYSLSSFAVVATHDAEQKALKVLRWLFNYSNKMLLKNRALIGSVYFMQDQHKHRIISLIAKVEILDNYWFKLLG